MASSDAATRAGRDGIARPHDDVRPRPLRTPLAVGDRAWCFLAAPLGRGEREVLVGAAQGRVVAISGDIYRVELLLISLAPLGIDSPHYRPGIAIEKTRAGLWSATCPLDHAAFAAEVRRFWPPSAGRRSSPP